MKTVFRAAWDYAERRGLSAMEAYDFAVWCDENIVHGNKSLSTALSMWRS